MTIRRKIFLTLALLPVVALIFFCVFAANFFINERLNVMRDIQITMANQKLIELSKEFQNIDETQELEDAKVRNIAFDPSDLYEILIINSQGKILVTNSPGEKPKTIFDVFTPDQLSLLRDPSSANRSLILEDLQKQRRHLSFAGTKNYAVIVSFLDSVLWRSAIPFLLKACGIFIILIVTIVAIGIYVSQSLIADLKKLAEIMNQFRSGDLKVRAKSQKKDEVSEVSKMFDSMANNIVEMMSSQQEKAALDKELELAQEVQRKMLITQTTFPDFIQYSSFLHTASSCGGDWIFYHVSKQQFVFALGDVTGHGVAAALLTGAARAAFAAFEIDTPPSPSEMTTVLNKAIYNTNQGSIQMTMFIGSLNMENLALRYSSASQETPFVIRAESDKVNRSNFIPLDEANGPRLGESATSAYIEQEFQMNRNDYLLCLSDGMYELQDASERNISEGALIRIICRMINDLNQPKKVLQNLESELRLTNDFTKLNDDLSMIFWRLS